MAKRTQRLKVYSMNLGGIERGLVATTSQKRAAELFGTTLYDFREMGGETFGPAAEIALAAPEIVFVQSFSIPFDQRHVWTKRKPTP
jgi:hypothetical protein